MGQDGELGRDGGRRRPGKGSNVSKSWKRETWYNWLSVAGQMRDEWALPPGELGFYAKL